MAVTDAQRARITYLKEKQEKWQTITETVNREFGTSLSEDQARWAWRNRDKTSQEPTNTDSGSQDNSEDSMLLEEVAQLVQEDKRRPEQLGFDGWMDKFKITQQSRLGHVISQHSAKSRIETDKPIALSMISDLHIGSPYTNYDAICSDVGKIAKHPRHFVMIGGDCIDNFTPGFKDARAVTGQLHPAMMQLLAMEALLNELDGKVIAKGGGNHDIMASKRTGLDAEYLIHRGGEYPYLPIGGLLTLTVGDTGYRILWRHHWRYNSTLNQFNSHHRMLEMLDPLADIVVQEHEHNAGIETVEKYEGEAKRQIVNIRAGAYKVNDPYSMEWFKSGTISPQTVILWPDKKKILALHGRDGIDDAQMFLRGHDATKKTKG